MTLMLSASLCVTLGATMRGKEGPEGNGRGHQKLFRQSRYVAKDKRIFSLGWRCQ